jgi:hypothetical protein
MSLNSREFLIWKERGRGERKRGRGERKTRVSRQRQAYLKLG